VEEREAAQLTFDKARAYSKALASPAPDERR
jgi:hypothetical protein